MIDPSFILLNEGLACSSGFPSHHLVSLSPVCSIDWLCCAVCLFGQETSGDSASVEGFHASPTAGSA